MNADRDGAGCSGVRVFRCSGGERRVPHPYRAPESLNTSGPVCVYLRSPAVPLAPVNKGGVEVMVGQSQCSSKLLWRLSFGIAAILFTMLAVRAEPARGAKTAAKRQSEA